MNISGLTLVLAGCLALAIPCQVRAQFKLADVTDNKDVTASGSQVTFASSLEKPGVTKTFRITNTSKTTQSFFPYFSPDSGFIWQPEVGGSDSIFDDGFGREFNTSLPRNRSGGIAGTVSTPASLNAGASMTFTLTWMPSRNPMQGVGTFFILPMTSGPVTVVVQLIGTAPPLAGADPVTDQLLYSFGKPAYVYDYTSLDTFPVYQVVPLLEPASMTGSPWFVSSDLMPDRQFSNGTSLDPAGTGASATLVHVLNDPPATVYKQRVRFNDGMFLATDSVKLPGRDNVGLELWFRAEPAGLSGQRMLAGMGKVLQDGFGLVIEDGAIKARAGAGGWLAGPKISAVEWHHAAVLVQAGVATLFVDGVAYGRRAKVQLPAAVAGLRLGGATETRTFLGEVDRLRVFVAPKGFSAPQHLLFNAPPIAMAIPQMPFDGLPKSVIDFGKVAAGAHWPASVPVRNLMPKTMHVTGAAIQGNASFSVTATLPMDVAVTTTASIPVEFSPVSAAVVTGYLVINTDDPLYPTIRVPLTGTGVTATKNVVITPANRVLDFGSATRVNDVSAPWQRILFTQTSSGVQDTTRFFNFTLSGPDADDFQLPAKSSVEVYAGGSAYYDVTFAPRSAGAHTATLKFETSDPATPVVTMQLTGSATAILNSLGVSLSDDVPVALTPMGRTLTLAVTAPVRGAAWQSLAINGPQAGDFSVRRILSTPPSLAQANDPGLVLPLAMQPGQTAYLELACIPAQTGDRGASLHFVTDAGAAGEFDYTVTAQVVPYLVLLDQGISVPVAGVQLPTLPAGSTLSHTLTLTNIGYAPVTSLNVSFTDGKGAFTLSEPQTTTLAPGASTQMTLSFTPAAATAYSAQITISSDNVESRSYAAYGSGSAALPPAQQLRSGWQTDLIRLTTRDMYLAGSDRIPGSGERSYRIRRLTNGVEDFSFGKSFPNGAVKAVVIQPDSSLYVAGSFTRVGGVARQGLAKLHADGSLDRSFAPPAGDFRGRAVSVLPDGRVLVGGAGSLGRKNLVLLLPDGSLDTSFNLTEPNGPVNVITTDLSRSSSIVVGGAFDNSLAASTSNNRTFAGALVAVTNLSNGWNASGMLSAPPAGSRFEITDVAGSYMCGFVHTTDANGVTRSEKRFGTGSTWRPFYMTTTRLLNARMTFEPTLVVAEPGTLVVTKNNDMYFAAADESAWPPYGNGGARAAVVKVNGSGTQLIGSVDGPVRSIAVPSVNSVLVGGGFSHVGIYYPLGNTRTAPSSPPPPTAVITPVDGFVSFTDSGVTSIVATTPVPPVVLPAPTLQVQDTAELDPMAEGAGIDFGAPAVATTRAFTVLNTSSTTSTGPVHIQLRSTGNSIFVLTAPDGTILPPGGTLGFSLACNPKWQGNTIASVQINDGSGTTRSVTFNVWATVGDNLAVSPSAGIGQMGATIQFAFLPAGSSSYYAATYQWLRNGTFITGATAASFHLKLASLADAGEYTCRVKRPSGWTIETAPVPIVVTSGGVRVDKLSNGVATLDVLFAGKPDSIQWMKNDVPAGSDATVKLAVKPDDVIKCVLKLGSATAAFATSQIALPAVPVVQPAAFSWTTSSDVNARLTAANAPLQFYIAGLPAGVTFDVRNGILSGRPRLPGSYTVRVAASNAAGIGHTLLIHVIVKGTPQIVSASLCGSWAARLGRDDAVTNGTGGQVSFYVLSNGTMTGTLTTGQAFPLTRASVVPAAAAPSANGVQITRFTGTFRMSAGGGVAADLPIKLSKPVNGATMVLHLELASTGGVTGTLRYGGAQARIDFGGLVNPYSYRSTSSFAVTMSPAPADAPASIRFGPYTTWIETFADQSRRIANATAMADGQWLLFRPALEQDGSGASTGVSSLSTVLRLLPASNSLQGSATSGNTLRGVVDQVISGTPF